MKKIIAVVSGLFIALSVSGHFALNKFSAALEKRLTTVFVEKTGWAVKTDKAPEVTFLFVPSVRFSGITLNAPQSEASVRIENARVEFEFFPILFGRIVPARAFLSDVAAKNISLKKFDFTIPVLALTFKNGEIALSGEAVSGTKRMTVSGKTDQALTGYELTLTGEKTVVVLNDAPDNRMAVRAEAAETPADKGPLALSAIVESPFSATPSVPYFKLSIGEITTAEGSLSSFDPAVYSVAASGRLPLRKKEKAVYAVRVEKGINSLSVPLLRFKSEYSDITNASFFSDKGENPRLSVKVEAETLTLRDLLFLYALARKGAGPAAEKTKRPYFSAEKFDPERIRRFKADVNIRAKETVSAAGKKLGPLTFTGNISDTVALSGFRLTLSDTLSGRLFWKIADTGVAESSMRLTMKNMPVDLIAMRNEYEGGTINGDAIWKAVGSSPKEMAENLNGRIRITGKDIAAPENQRQIPSQITNIVSTLKVPDKIYCVVVNTPIVNGVLTSDKRIAAETDVYDAQINGDIDFGKDKIDLTLLLTPKESDFINSLLTDASITGALSDPKLKLNTDTSLQNALIYGLSFLKGGKKLAQQAVRTEAPGDVCKEALRK